MQSLTCASFCMSAGPCFAFISISTAVEQSEAISLSLPNLFLILHLIQISTGSLKVQISTGSLKVQMSTGILKPTVSTSPSVSTSAFHQHTTHFGLLFQIAMPAILVWWHCRLHLVAAHNSLISSWLIGRCCGFYTKLGTGLSVQAVQVKIQSADKLYEVFSML